MPPFQHNDDELAQYFDFANASLAGSELAEIAKPAGFGIDNEPTHAAMLVESSDLDQNVCNRQPGKDQLQLRPNNQSSANDDEQRFVKPDQPCDNCRAKQYECYMTFGKVICKACHSLSKPCSFVHGGTSQDISPPALDEHLYLDAMDAISDASPPRGTFNKAQSPTPTSTAELDNSKKTATATRFSRTAVKILRDWLDAHVNNPYPNDHEKIELEQRTGLRTSQISTWLANARRRSKVGKSHKRSQSPSIPGARDIPGAHAARNMTPWNELNPLERWQHSPPENEPAPMHAIADAVAHNDLPRAGATTHSPFGYQGHGSSSASHSVQRAESMSSMETTNKTISRSATSSAVWSGSQDSFGSFGSFSGGLHGKRDRRRRRRVVPKAPNHTSDKGKRRIFQCTFCCDTFMTKYDWTRHEKSLHLSLDKWICAPLGWMVTDPTTGVEKCAYCHVENPDSHHPELHNHAPCHAKDRDARTFYRKDHLRQHLRIMHNCEMQPHMEQWKVEASSINSRCGFCMQRFRTWQARCDHLAQHFKEGADMKDWRGCRGLDPDVASQVLNGMPPYLIGMERDTPVPFSATKSSAGYNTYSEFLHADWGKNLEESSPDCGHNYDVTARDPRRATCWEILTIALGAYAKAQTEQGIILTDEMLQTQARRLLYDSDDAWNQTAADHPEWLNLFKKAHGLDILPTAVGGTGNMVPEDLELYSDLGMRVPFSVQLQGMQRGRDGRRAQMIGDTPEYNGNYTSYSALIPAAERVGHFATIAEPTFIPGMLGRQISTAEWQVASDIAAVHANLSTAHTGYFFPTDSRSGSNDTSQSTSTPASEAISADQLSAGRYVLPRELGDKINKSSTSTDGMGDALAMDIRPDMPLRWALLRQSNVKNSAAWGPTEMATNAPPLASEAQIDKALEEFDFNEITNPEWWPQMAELPGPGSG